MIANLVRIFNTHIYYLGVCTFMVFLYTMNTINVIERNYVYNIGKEHIELKYDVIIGLSPPFN